MNTRTRTTFYILLRNTNNQIYRAGFNLQNIQTIR